MLQIMMFVYYKIKAKRDIFEEKIYPSNFVNMKNPTMIQLNRIQLTSRTPNHVEMTKILSMSQRESRIIDC